MNDYARGYSHQLIWLAIVFGLAGLIVACSNDGGRSLAEMPAQASTLRARELPTLYPTATLLPSPTPTSPNELQPTAAPSSEVDFDQLVVDVHYVIPSLELDRRIRGNVAGVVEVIDQNDGASVMLKNRPGVIVEMQQALLRAQIEKVPEGCISCVQVDYELPLTEQSGQGWLRDVQLLASLENYTAAVLGPHFPAGTMAGLRREATPFEVAHSVAVSSEGQLWTWTATDMRVAEPTIVAGIGEQAAGHLASIDWLGLPDSIGHVCYEGGGAEWLQLEGPDRAQLIDVRCPELYLPGQLAPIYSLLSDAVVAELAGGDVSPPDLPMTLDTIVYFGRTDGASLTVSSEGQLDAIDAEGASYTVTLTTTETLSLTSVLLDSSLLSPGPSALFDEEPGNIILIRANDSVYELAWSEQDEIPAALIELWDGLFELAFQSTGQQSGEAPTPSATATGTGG